MKLKDLYHVGIPVDDIDRAREFYTKVLGMRFLDRVGGGKGPRLDRLRCGTSDVVLFERPKPIHKNALEQDGIAHQAFDMQWDDYDDALKEVKETGRFDRCVDRASGKTIYLFDPEGNYLELHFPTPIP
jgi:catechol 2,3-dioxygenase-like lactoylglutathione lyase family enzyme